VVRIRANCVTPSSMQCIIHQNVTKRCQNAFYLHKTGHSRSQNRSRIIFHAGTAPMMRLRFWLRLRPISLGLYSMVKKIQNVSQFFIFFTLQYRPKIWVEARTGATSLLHARNAPTWSGSGYFSCPMAQIVKIWHKSFDFFTRAKDRARTGAATVFYAGTAPTWCSSR
jgi:hypothetical protein